MSNSTIIAENIFGLKRYSWLHNDNLAAISVSYEQEKSKVGQIHFARVTKISNAGQGAFVELAKKETAFLPFKQAKKYTPLQEGQYIIVQVTRDAEDSKDIRVSGNISLTGFYWVIFPNAKQMVKLSKKITRKEDIERIIELAENKLMDEPIGITARTAARNTQNEDLIKELDILIHKWNSLVELTSSCKKPTLLLDLSNPLVQFVLNDIDIPAELIIFDSKEHMQEIEVLEELLYMPHLELAVADNPMNLYQDFNLQEQYDDLLNNRVTTHSGAWLDIVETSAATLIDVNSGADFAIKSASQINMAILGDIAKQIRLRNLSGQILIDFISDNNKNNQQKLIAKLKQILRSDPQNPDILGFSRLGILEISRKKRGLSLGKKLLKNESNYHYNDDIDLCFLMLSAKKQLTMDLHLKIDFFANEKAIKVIKKELQNYLDKINFHKHDKKYAYFQQQRG